MSKAPVSVARIIVLLILSFNSIAYSQLVYAGIKAGTPLSASTASAIIASRAGGGLSALNIRRYTVGPTIEIALPFGLRFEADALCTRLDRTDHHFFSPTFGDITRVSANAWEFPLLFKYPFVRRRYSPFVAAGGTFRRIQSFAGSTETFAFGLQPPYSLVRYRIDQPLTQGGMAVGGGVRMVTVGPLKVTPEIRYTRWTSLQFLPTRNQVQFLLSLGL